MMLNVSKAKDRLAHILLFFQVSFHLFTEHHGATADNGSTRAVLPSVLELVYRVYTDDQYDGSAPKSLSIELIDHLSTAVDKAHFITVYNEVKAGVHKKRQQRKKMQQIRMAGADGAKIKERKRERKNIKKKEQKRQKIMQFELRKN